MPPSRSAPRWSRRLRPRTPSRPPPPRCPWSAAASPLPASNVNPKSLVLYAGSQNGRGRASFYPDALGAGTPAPPLPTESQGCVGFTLSRGVAPGAYTIALEDASTGNAFAAVSFTADRE